jgi:hypothetical protein
MPKCSQQKPENAMTELNLVRDAFGHLVFTDNAGNRHTGIVPVHAFPISAPGYGVTLLSASGQELLWLEQIEDLPGHTRQLLLEELAQREFIPVIRRIIKLNSYALPSTWEVETEQGDCTLVLKSEDDIRRLSGHGLLIADSNGINYLIRDKLALDRESQRILDRFL